MKKLFLSATLAVAALSGAQAQSVKFGLKAGGNLSNLSGDLTNQNQYNNRLGFHGGVMLNIGLIGGDVLSLQPEALYSQKGFNYEDTSVGGINRTGNVRYDYLDVPLLLKLKAGGVFFEAGPQYSYLMQISDNRAQTISGAGSTTSSSTANLTNVNRNELGYVAGLGFQSRLGFLLGVRYNGAFTDFAKDGYSNNDFRNARNSAFQGYIGFLLGGR